MCVEQENGADGLSCTEVGGHEGRRREARAVSGRASGKSFFHGVRKMDGPGWSIWKMKRRNKKTIWKGKLGSDCWSADSALYSSGNWECLSRGLTSYCPRIVLCLQPADFEGRACLCCNCLSCQSYDLGPGPWTLGRVGWSCRGPRISSEMSSNDLRSSTVWRVTWGQGQHLRSIQANRLNASRVCSALWWNTK